MAKLDSRRKRYSENVTVKTRAVLRTSRSAVLFLLVVLTRFVAAAVQINPAVETTILSVESVYTVFAEPEVTPGTNYARSKRTVSVCARFPDPVLVRDSKRHKLVSDSL